MENDSHQELNNLKLYLEAAIDSSTRHRRIVVIMVTASILILGTFWNSVYFGWLNSRIKVLESASVVLNSILQKENLKKIKELGNGDHLQKNLANSWKEKAGILDTNLDDKIDRLNKLSEKELTKCKDYLDFKTKEFFNEDNFESIKNEPEKVSVILSRIEPQKEELQKVKGQNFYLIRIPFFWTCF